MIRKILILFFLLVIITGCSSREDRYKASGKMIDPGKPISWGHQQTIYVFADDNVWKYAEKPIRQSL
ncbi:MAG: hypothetical protein KAU01_12600, partial [Candidatus Cloacimonetes bacterium]|nr:hypothetical protein [Candidatus Cloacimonadota bacterium]